MQYIKEKFNTNCNLLHIFVYFIFGIVLYMLLCSSFLYLGLIKFSLVESSIDSTFLYYLVSVLKNIFICAVAPFIQELFFKGLIYDIFLKRFNKVIAAIFTITIFVLFKLSLISAIYALVFGIISMILYIKSNNLIFPFVMSVGFSSSSLFGIFYNCNIIVISIMFVICTLLFFVCYNFKADK